jgi:hypothetical protein
VHVALLGLVMDLITLSCLQSFLISYQALESKAGALYAQMNVQQEDLARDVQIKAIAA